MIKPDDIPNELMAAFGHIYGPDLVAFLNAAVDAGVVSPPCWAVRDTHGNLVKSTEVYTSKEAAEHDVRFSWDKVEHWKGQTE